MDYLHSFKLLLAITLFASVIAIENSNEIMTLSSKEWVEYDTPEFTNNEADYARKMANNWFNDFLNAVKHLGSVIKIL